MNDEGRNRAVLAVFLLAWLVVGASIVALLSPPTLQDIREHRRMAQWPVVAAIAGLVMVARQARSARRSADARPA